MPYSDSPNDITGTLLLCDGAQAVGGKLYIMGGGWSIVHRLEGMPPPHMALAIRLEIPWSRANQRMELLIKLLNDGGEPVEDPEGNPVQIQGEVEAGRPPGLPEGTSIDIPMAAEVGGIPLDPGGYVWQMEVAGAVVARQPLRVMPASAIPPGFMSPPG